MDTVTITKADIERALRRWDADAVEGQWPDRSDDEKYADNADYLFGLLSPITA